jgi:hypothetical protein
MQLKLLMYQARRINPADLVNSVADFYVALFPYVILSSDNCPPLNSSR